MDKTFDKKIVKQKAKEKIKEGIPKQQVYDDLVEEYFYRNDIAKIVREIPTNKRWAKYGYLNIIYLVFFSLLTLSLFIIQPSGGLVLLGGIIYVVAAKKFSLYYWNILFGVIVILILAGFTIVEGSNLSIPLTALMFFVPIISIVAGVYLPKLISPLFTEVKESYINSEGEDRLMLVHKFVE